MEAPPLVARHRFLMDDWVQVVIAGKVYRGRIIGIRAPDVDVSKINPYGIRAHQINAYHSDTYSVIFFSPPPYQFNHVNQDENTQPYQANEDENTQTGATSHETNNGTVISYESSHGMVISYRTNPRQFDANRSHLAAAMHLGLDLYNPNAYVFPYTVILYGIIPGDFTTYVHNPFPMTLFRISPESLVPSAAKVYLDADIPFRTGLDMGAYSPLPGSAMVPSYIVEIQYRLQDFYR